MNTHLHRAIIRASIRFSIKKKLNEMNLLRSNNHEKESIKCEKKSIDLLVCFGVRIPNEEPAGTRRRVSFAVIRKAGEHVVWWW